MDRLIMIVLLLIVLITTVSMMLYYKASKKKILITVGVILMIFGTERVYKYIHCGPDSSDVKLMKPMAQKIADYIVAHGTPKSLADIQGLPYVVERCKRTTGDTERCQYESVFEIKANRYWTTFRIEIENEVTKTGIFYELNYSKERNKYILEESGSYSTKDDGICQPFRP